MTIRAMGIYQTKNENARLRLVATGEKRGLLWEFMNCRDLKLPKLYYPANAVTIVYRGNCMCAPQ